ncbi:Glycosyltransferase, GT2 family [Pseudorhodobacter antarcticus]|uniref:Glycosyltransferase, GT2 family n=1 Tax=Pseudorhodobacter antarcticus TaxID=1077947 RepID=A0A1H8NMG0_9RHOB|nr:glycosyltransferase [Pseudorhodobacter antarcticus]SEO30742.1 Glycosyltransferase, GT2 family [Pseudorhodobacter antarcticus]
MTQFLQHDVSEPAYFPQTSWGEHGSFAMWLVKVLRPRRIVELGTHNGFSYFSMCQSVKEAGLPTECFAVDTWTGDEHAGAYSEVVFDSVRIENRKYASFSTLLRKTFDEALDDIKDGSVDLLHVDGRHFYDDVKHDFESWVPKLSDRAVVLFHDTVVQERGFGVYKYWAEISEKYPSFNFTHCHGLGVLLHGSDVASNLRDLVALSRANEGPGVVESFFEAVGGAMLARKNLQGLADQAKAIKLKDKEITLLQKRSDTLSSLLINARQRPLKQLRRLIVSRVLMALSKASSPLSPRTASRFARSAAKRDPKRIELENVSSRERYAELLEAWAIQREAMAGEIRALVQRLSGGPMLSVIVPVYNTDPALLQEMIDSVTSQSYSNWELCIADDASPNPRIKDVLSKAAESDTRIRIVFRDENGHISHASNSAIELAQGDYLVFIDHDDVLDPDALLYVAECIDQHPAAKIIYTDEDKIREDGSRYDPHFKPDWNRELLYSYNYISHLVVYATDIVRKIGGFRPGYEGVQDHDLLLRCLPLVGEEDIHHIPKVLYSERASLGNTVDTADSKSYAWTAGVQAMANALSDQYNQKIKVERGSYPFTYLPQWPLANEPSVTIVIPTRDRLDITRVTVDSILATTDYGNFEIVIVDNGSVEAETLAWFKEITRSSQVKVIRDDGPFNYSTLNNKAVAQSRSDIVALVNNDIEIISGGWLREMVSLAIRADVGCVGAKLYYPDDTIQHAGVVVTLGSVAGHSHKYLARDDSGYFLRVMLRQEYSAVTAACLVVRRAVYEAVGGLNEQHLAIAFNDVDFCLKVKAAGYRNLWTPLAEMYHHESASRKTEDTPAKRARFKNEVQYMKDTWQTDTTHDPAYNPNLSKHHEDFRFGPARW